MAPRRKRALVVVACCGCGVHGWGAPPSLPPHWHVQRTLGRRPATGGKNEASSADDDLWSFRHVADLAKSYDLRHDFEFWADLDHALRVAGLDNPSRRFRGFMDYYRSHPDLTESTDGAQAFSPVGFFPDLELPEPIHDSSDFPWAASITGQSQVIKGELDMFLRRRARAGRGKKQQGAWASGDVGSGHFGESFG